MLPLLADVVWPGLILTDRLAVWWIIAASLVIEAVILWRWAPMCSLKAAAGSLVMNAVSAFFGILLLPVASIGWEVLASHTYMRWFDLGTFNVATYIATWAIAVVLSTVIETFILWLVFLEPWTRRLICVVLAGNALTVGLAGLTTFFWWSS
jgi:hypothetical protein